MNVSFEYCGREQPAENLRCIACSALLPAPAPTRVTLIESVPESATPLPTSELDGTLKGGLDATGAVGRLLFALLGFYFLNRAG